MAEEENKSKKTDEKNGEIPTEEFAEKPKEGEPWDTIIVGSGPAAFTAAIYTTRGAASTLIIGGEKWGGQLMLTTDVDNYPGFPRGIQGPELMEKFRAQAERFGAEFVAKNVTDVNFEVEPKEIFVDDKKYLARTVIIATGAETKWLEVPGEEKLRGKGVSSCAPCDAPFFKEKEVMVVGGGDSAMEEALVLTKYADKVTIIHRRDEFSASEAMQQKVFDKEKEGKVNILWDTEVAEMLGEEKLERVRLKTSKDSDQAKKLEEGEFDKYKGEKKEDPPSHESSEGQGKVGFVFWEAPIEGLFVAIGHTPATEVFQEDIELDEKGYVVVHHHTKTNKENGVFVAGDVHDYVYRQAVTAAGFGCMAGMDTLKYLDELDAQKKKDS